MDARGSRAVPAERKIPEGPERDTFSYPQQVKVFLQFLREEEFEMYTRHPFYITYLVLYTIMLK